MKDNKEFIKGIYEKYDEYQKDTQKFKQVKNINDKEFQKHNFMKGSFVKVLSAAAVFAIVLSGVFVSQNMFKNENGELLIGKTTTNDNISLKTVNDFETFCKIVKDYSEDTSKSRGNMLYDVEDATTESKTPSPSDLQDATNSEATNASSTEDYSKTNIQVENVDEADIVKTNGNYIFYVVSNKILIVDIQDRNEMKTASQIFYRDSKFKPSELYINENKLIVIGNESGYSYSNNVVKETSSGIYKRGIYKQKTIAVVYDISNINQPKEERRVELDGRYLSSRMIDGNIYFISSKSISTYEILRNEPTKLYEDMFKPTYTDTATSNNEKCIDFDRIYYFDNIENINYLTLGGFSLNNKQEADVKTFLGAGETVYSSAQNMYIVKSKTVYDADTFTSFGKDTKILKFSLDNGNINFKAEANVEGGINNQFSMDENNGYFRIATTIGKTYNMDDSTSNSLYILDKDMKEVGRLDGIAKAEKIYSVRYVGDKAYVVTFKEIDPLFVIDLSDVRNPKILGELKIPGYSTYLHPYDETHLIGFGYDTKPNAYNTGIVRDGLKMSMFDISDLNNPKELFSIKIGDSSTSSELANNHKALLFSKEKNFIAFPTTSYLNGKREYKAQIYDIDLNKGFTLRGEIEHKNDTLSDTNKYYSYRLKIDRIIYSKDVFYTLSKDLIKASDMSTLNQITKLDIKD